MNENPTQNKIKDVPDSKWFLTFAIFLVTLVFYTGISYQRLSNVELQLRSIVGDLGKLSDLEELKYREEMNSHEIERLRNRLDKVSKLVE